VDLTDSDAYRNGEPNRRALVELGGVRTSLQVALRRDESVLGSIQYLSPGSAAVLRTREIALLQNFAAQAVIAIEKRAADHRDARSPRTTDRDRRGARGHQFSPGDLAPVFDAILEKAHSLCGAAFGSLFTYDGEFFHGAASHGMPEAIQARSPRPVSPWRNNPLWQLAHGAPLAACPRYEGTRRRVGAGSPSACAPSSNQGGIRTMLMVPLRKDGALLGVISAYSPRGEALHDKQIALLQKLRRPGGHRDGKTPALITETQEALEQQTATAEVLGVINSSPGDLAPVFDAILEKAHPRLRGCGRPSWQSGTVNIFTVSPSGGVSAELPADFLDPFRPAPGKYGRADSNGGEGHSRDRSPGGGRLSDRLARRARCGRYNRREELLPLLLCTRAISCRGHFRISHGNPSVFRQADRVVAETFAAQAGHRDGRTRG